MGPFLRPVLLELNRARRFSVRRTLKTYAKERTEVWCKIDSRNDPVESPGSKQRTNREEQARRTVIEATIDSAVAWITIASIRLITRRLARA